MLFPKIVIEVEGGFIRSIYYEGLETSYAIYDRDQAEIEEEPVVTGRTQFIDDLPEEMGREINNVLLQDALDNKYLVEVANEASEKFATVGLIVDLDYEHAHLIDCEGGEVGLFEAWELRLHEEGGG